MRINRGIGLFVAVWLTHFYPLNEAVGQAQQTAELIAPPTESVAPAAPLIDPGAISSDFSPGSHTFDSQIERGQPRPIIDALGWVWGIPQKLLLWDRRAVNHKVSPQTEESIAQYMAVNGMRSTKVRINQYAPGDEWRRLGSNTKVGAGWRYTFGALTTAFYTILPGRVFGADWYNPYTDSVYIYSDIPAIAMEQGGHAKLVAKREHPGTYASLTALPLVHMWPESRAKDDVLLYVRSHGTTNDRMDTVASLYPQFGSEFGQQAGYVLPYGFLFAAAGAGMGHIAAGFENHGIYKRRQEVIANQQRAAAAVIVQTPAAELPPASVSLPPKPWEQWSATPVSYDEPVVPPAEPTKPQSWGGFSR